MASEQHLSSSKRVLEVDPNEPATEPAAKRLALDVQHAPTDAGRPGSPPLVPNPSLDQGKVAEIIRQQFGLEILLKHDELRLIDQEIAKCQIALEQLRRAKLVPYPSQTGRIEDMLNVSTGAGPALVPAGMRYPPTHPPPYGVADGPYSRSYASWLIPAPEFEGGLPSSRTAAGRIYGSERRSRGHFEDPILTSSRVRGQRGSAGGRLQALPLGYPQPKGIRGPLTLKKQSDGKWVKLVCQNCHREDFSSVQGFINHCRISHQVHFATHEDAAQKAGTEEGVDQATGEVIGALTTTLPRPAGAALASTHVTTMSGLNAGPSELVHKFNRHSVDPKSMFPARAVSPPPSAPSSFKTQRDRARRGSNMGPPVSPSFVPSTSTPHLSALFAKTGRAGNLDALVKDARTKEDLEVLASPTTPDGFEPRSPELMPRNAHVAQSGLGPLSGRSKGPGRKTAPGSSLAATTQGDSCATPKASPASPTEQSPFAAMDTNQAPSLVSDDGQSGSEGEDEEEQRPANLHADEPSARINGVDGVAGLLDDDTPDGPSTMEVEEKMSGNWRHRGDSRPPDRRQGPPMQT